MLFNSIDYILFFASVVLFYYILPHRFRWILLLISSCIFYMSWRAELILLILFSSFLNYSSSMLIDMTESHKKKKFVFALCIFINFALLFIFKYMMFINHTFMAVYEYFGIHYPIEDFNIILPMGISFYTFQAASYTIDVYKGEYKPERNFFRFTLFITFFPQLVAGPIERADRLMKQLFTEKKFDTDNFSMGLKYMLLGFFKKVVIADRAAILVNSVFNNAHNFDGTSFIIAVLFFTFQIYCDFSGYSDIAIGSAKVLGIDLMQNFNKPYFSSSVKEFWRRWHISLSSWLRDYVYIPLGGSRCSLLRKYYNIFVTFALSGLWHGANWTFVLWGIIHGLYQITEDIISKIFSFVIPHKKDENEKKGFLYYFLLPFRAIIHIIRVIFTFILVAFAWIFFRANSTDDALYIITHLTDGIENIT
ncbi:MAG: MBOAT family protein, partial [Firmicutes bacterium]|nr:MBOAT family protein [Bacillota bacterium]